MRTTGLLESLFFDIQSSLKKQAVAGTVDRKGYVAALGDLLSLESLETFDREFAIGMLVKIFNAYDEESTMAVPINNLTAGLRPLCRLKEPETWLHFRCILRRSRRFVDPGRPLSIFT